MGKRVRRVEDGEGVEAEVGPAVSARVDPAPDAASQSAEPDPIEPQTPARVPVPVSAAATSGGPAFTRAEVFTLPNLLSAVRILLVPVFVWLVLVPEADLLAIGVLILSGFTDYLDGKIARSTGTTTRLGAILDPVADRLYILAVVISLALREVIPWWLAVILPLRDVLLFSLIPFLRTRGFSALPVHFLGKAATAGLLYAFPLLLLGDGEGAVANLARVFGWAFTIWGVGLYWWAGVLYVFQLRRLLATTPRVR